MTRVSTRESPVGGMLHPQHFDFAVLEQLYPDPRHLVVHLLFIAEHSPDLAEEAYVKTLELLKSQLKNKTLFQRARDGLDALRRQRGQGEGEEEGRREEKEWLSMTHSTLRGQVDRLQAELAEARNGRIQERIFLSHTQLANVLIDAGDYEEAGRHLSRAREYALSERQVREIAMTFVDVNVLSGSYTHIRTKVSQLELEGFIGDRDGRIALAPEQRQISSRLSASSALDLMASRVYAEVAQLLLVNTNLPDLEGYNPLPSRTALIYGVLSALAVKDREFSRVHILNNPSLRSLLSFEPYLLDPVRMILQGDFSQGLSILLDYQDDFRLDPLLYKTFPDLLQKIRQACLIQCLSTYSRVHLDALYNRMGQSFGGVDEVEHELTSLMRANRLPAYRLDLARGIVHRKPLPSTLPSSVRAKDGLVEKAIRIGRAYEEECEELETFLQLHLSGLSTSTLS